MTEASDAAYAEAVQLIATAKASGVTALDLNTRKTRSLTTLPPEIGTLTGLITLDLSKTKVADLAPIAALTALTSLDLSGTRITDLTQIAALTALTTLSLFGTQVIDLSPLTLLTALSTLKLSATSVADLSPIAKLTDLTVLGLFGTNVNDLPPLAGLTKLAMLGLYGTQVSDLSALDGLTALIWLDLHRTPITDLSPLTTLTRLTTLNLRGTQITDLTPLLHLTGLLTPGDPGDYMLGEPDPGVQFAETPACADPRIAEIARMPNPARRARALFNYLQNELEETDPTQDITPPPRQPAPLETEILDDRLVVALPPTSPLPAGPVDDRARNGWEILKQFRADFANVLHIANYRPLASAAAAFDRAMGDSYDHLNEIAVGLVGERLSALSQDAEFVRTLPEGAGTELATLGAAVTTFANRFPDWLAYLNDPADALPVAATVQDNLAAFTELEKSLATSDDVAPDVLAEYRDEVELVRRSPNSEVAARALLASTRELLRTLSENALIGLRLYGEELLAKTAGVGQHGKAAAIREAAKFKELAPNEFRKFAYKSVTKIAAAVVVYKSGILVALAVAFPAQFGWISAIAVLLASK